MKVFEVAYRDACKGNKESQVLHITGYGLNTSDGGGRNLVLKDISKPKYISEHYQMLMGKKSECKNEANEIVYTFEDNLQRPLRMVVRLYNDGVAFRYELEGLQHTSIKQDLTTYHISEGTRRWFQEWTESYENFFPLSTTGKGGKQHWGYPCLLEQNGVYSLITEAGIERINSASSLKNGQNPEDYHVFLDENTQHYSGNWKSPWRVVVIGKKQDLIASTLVTDVSAPCRLKGYFMD